MIQSGENPDVATYATLLHGYATEGNLVEMNNLIQIYACSKCGRLDEAMLTFNKMRC